MIIRFMNKWNTAELIAAGEKLITDEVLTGFGRRRTMCASEYDDVMADIVILDKALTGGCLSLVITLVTDAVCSAFSCVSSAETTLSHGHSYTGNALACAAAKAMEAIRLAIVEECRES